MSSLKIGNRKSKHRGTLYIYASKVLKIGSGTAAVTVGGKMSKAEMESLEGTYGITHITV